MESQKNKKILFVALLLVLIGIAIAILILGKFFTRPKTETPNNQSATEQRVKIIDPLSTSEPRLVSLEESKLPERFPSDFFYEPDAVFVNSSNINFPDGRLWATRSYLTDAEFNAISRDYKTYIESTHLWKFSPIQGQEKPDISYLYAKKIDSNTYLIIQISKTSSQKSRVDINFDYEK